MLAAASLASGSKRKFGHELKLAALSLPTGSSHAGWPGAMAALGAFRLRRGQSVVGLRNPGPALLCRQPGHPTAIVPQRAEGGFGGAGGRDRCRASEAQVRRTDGRDGRAGGVDPWVESGINPRFNP